MAFHTTSDSAGLTSICGSLHYTTPTTNLGSTFASSVRLGSRASSVPCGPGQWLLFSHVDKYGLCGSNHSLIAWQHAERASVRLAARSTLPPAPMALHPAQTSTHFYHGGILAFPIMPAPPPLPKRPLDQSEDESAPKAKKSRAKSKSTSEGPGGLYLICRVICCLINCRKAGSSRRGYNAKKRNEAAQIAAQNGMRSYYMPSLPEAYLAIIATTLVPMIPVTGDRKSVV